MGVENVAKSVKKVNAPEFELSAQEENVSRLVEGCFASPICFAVPLREIQRTANELRAKREICLQIYTFAVQELLKKSGGLVGAFEQGSDRAHLLQLVNGLSLFSRLFTLFYHPLGVNLSFFLRGLTIEQKLIKNMIAEVRQETDFVLAEIERYVKDSLRQLNEELLDNFLENQGGEGEYKSEEFVEEVFRMSNFLQVLGSGERIESDLIEVYHEVWDGIYETAQKDSFAALHRLFTQVMKIQSELCEKIGFAPSGFLKSVNESFCAQTFSFFAASLTELIFGEQSQIILFFYTHSGAEALQHITDEIALACGSYVQQADSIPRLLASMRVITALSALLAAKDKESHAKIKLKVRAQLNSLSAFSPTRFRKYLLGSPEAEVLGFLAELKEVFESIYVKAPYFEAFYVDYVCHEITGEEQPKALRALVSYWESAFGNEELVKNYTHLQRSTRHELRSSPQTPLELVSVNRSLWPATRGAGSYDVAKLLELPWIKPHLQPLSLSQNPRVVTELQPRFCVAEVAVALEGGQKAALKMNLEQMALTMWADHLPRLQLSSFQDATGMDGAQVRQLVSSLNRRVSWVGVEDGCVVLRRLPDQLQHTTLNLAADHFRQLFEKDAALEEAAEPEQAARNASDKALRAAIVFAAKELKSVSVCHLKERLRKRLNFSEEQFSSGVEALIAEELLERAAGDPAQLNYL